MITNIGAGKTLFSLLQSYHSAEVVRAATSLEVLVFYKLLDYKHFGDFIFIALKYQPFQLSDVCLLILICYVLNYVINYVIN